MSNSDPIKDGDRVCVDGAGPLMSVQAMTDDSALCMWLDDSGKLLEQWFPLIALQKVQSGDGPQ